MKYFDPYLNENGVLKNKLGINDSEKLEEAEKLIVNYKMLKIDEQDFGKSNNVECLKNINKYLFGELYEWAGETRKIDMIKYEKIKTRDKTKNNNFFLYITPNFM